MDEREQHRFDLMEDALIRIAEWARAYPPEMFPEPDDAYLKKADEVLTANGMSLGRISASNVRQVIIQVGEIAEEARP